MKSMLGPNKFPFKNMIDLNTYCLRPYYAVQELYESDLSVFHTFGVYLFHHTLKYYMYYKENIDIARYFLSVVIYLHCVINDYQDSI